ncbi:SP_1767 family glycosyltransferase [Sutcliffiella horikoshii]|uniref:SP_1767 family glycosyltransferase n=1 Tax=Sutcliffiella horikoshii TaxID=79883 RepID=A0AA94WQ11_9BACI|nr:SP_1767 family glycosyltransferase [Sutcliffiella horikoshii]TYS60082.1 SP_1767 family glycosyltransferase [Sutcliffiella horikoshii]
MKKHIVSMISVIYSLYLFSKDTFISTFFKAPIVCSNEQTIEKIINDKCSVSRFGDGEFYLLTETKDLKFQKKSNELSKCLKEVIDSNEKNLLICIPKVFKKTDLTNRTEESMKFWKSYLRKFRFEWYKILNRKRTYYSSTFTRNYIALSDKSDSLNYFQKVKKIWEDRDLLIVEGEFSRMGVGNSLFDNVKSIERILAPSENAFEKYKEILLEVKQHNKDKLIIIGLGPTATVLAYDLHKCGYQAIDIGHLDVEFEWFLQKSIIKTKVRNKYVIEANHKIQDSEGFIDEKYESQILKKIK